ncbi:MAG: CheR family methyltransferase, partial [Aureliella sp.]
KGLLTAKWLDIDEQSAPIDHLFTSLAEDMKELSVGVVLSGTGTDATLGLKAIADAGGMTIAQSLGSAAERSMPNSAAAIGGVDHVLPPEAIAVHICHYAQHMQELENSNAGEDLNRQILVAIPQIAAAVEKHTQNDFKHYKTTTLTRRIRRRIHVLKLNSVDAYIELLQTSREEALRLFRDLLISVTAFFRDRKAFDALGRDVLSPLIERHEGEGPLRVWIPGCATGQEAYSIAIALVEAMERCEKKVAVQIFATDLDERALSIARSGGYPIGIQDEVTEQRLHKYFTKRGNRYFLAKKLRDMIVFSAHNLISDPPFTKVDLISCRNLLIYLGSHLQKKLIPLFHYAIKPSGYLFLGPAETLSVNRELFRTLHSKHRLYQRRVTALDRPQVFNIPMMKLNRNNSEAENGTGEVDLFRFAQQIILGEFSPQWAIIDDDGRIRTLSSDPSPFLKMSGGHFKNNVIAMAHENLRIGLRAAFSEAKEHRRRALAEDMSVPVEGGLQRVHITVQPMPEMGQEASLHLVVFHRIGTPLQVDADPDSVKVVAGARLVDSSAAQVIEQLERELSRTREALEHTVQELETSNEELKSSNEELLSMNEEMQTANELLETSKEELQTSNENLIRSNNDTQNLLRSTQIATIFLDNDLRIRGFTPAVTEIYPLVDTDIGRKLLQFAPAIEGMPKLPEPKSLADDSVAEEIIDAVNGKSYIRRVISYRTPSGENDGIIVTFNDVTELSNSQQLFKSLVDVSAQIVWVADSSGTIIEDSPSWREFTGQSYEQWIGHGWMDVIHPDDRQPTLQTWQLAVQNQHTFSIEYRLKHKSGEYRWTEVRAVANRSPSGEVYRWVGMNRDITQRKQFEQSLEAARGVAEAANLSKSAFLANMSHEIRTPMTAILGYVDLVADKIRDQETSYYVRTIRRNGAFLLEIINDILDLSKIEAGKLDVAQETFAPRRLIEDVHSIMNVRASESSIELAVEYQTDLPRLVLSDAKRLKQILINLIGNAIKFTPQGSVKIIVCCDHRTQENGAAKPAKSQLKFQIVDTGIGMSEKQLEKLFQPFSQGDGNVNREFGGTGLGLAISRRLAEMLGGEISVESELGRGSTFTVTVAVEDVSHQATSLNQTNISRTQTLPQPAEDIVIDAEILIVDDRRDIRFLSNAFLSKAGASVNEAEDGEVAIRMVEQAIKMNEVYDLILLDMQMPRLDGYQTAQALRHLGYTGPIIALTADAMQGDMSRCLDAGCNDYLSKPIDRNVMLHKVHSYLQNHTN